MRKRVLFFSSSLLMAIAILSYDLPKGWSISGSRPNDYAMGTDYGKGQDGKNAATIRSVKRNIHGFGTLMQSFDADNYKGKRLRLTGYVKALDVDNWAGLWMRVDGKTMSPLLGKKVRTTLTFDNMYNRSIKGSQDFTKYEIVLDVPDTATSIAYGALLNGTGQIWFDNLKFDIVGTDVPVTYSKAKEPTNMDFDK